MGYIAGFSQGATFTPDGGAPAVLPIKTHSWEEAVNAIDTSDSSSGGLEKCLAAILRGTGNVTAGVDTLQFPSGVSIRAGQKGTMTFAVGMAAPFSVHCMILKVHYANEGVDGWISYNFDVKMDATSGAYTRPA